MTTTQTCTVHDCGRPTSLYLCNQCVRDLQAWIDKVPEAMAELFTTMARLDNVATGRNGGTPTKTETPAPVRFDALDVRGALRRWLYRTGADLSTDPFAGKFLPELIALLTKAQQLIDLPDDELIEVAPCECGTKLEARPDYTEVTCPECGLTYTRAAIDQWRTGAINEAAQLADADATVAWVNERARKHITSKDLINWVKRRKIRFVLDHVPNDTAKAKRLFFPGEVLRLRHRHLKPLDRKAQSV